MQKDSIDEEAPIPEGFSDDETAFLRRYLGFYRGLETGQRTPTTDAQRRFVAMCQGHVAAVNEHEKVYAKYMRLRPKSQSNVRPGWDVTEWRDRYDREH